MKQTLGTKLYYSIGEVAELTDLQPYTLRSWEKEFPSLRPKRLRGKNRAYRERDIGIILLIKRLLYDERYSTRGARQRLKNEPELVRGAVDNVVSLRNGAEISVEDIAAAGRQDREQQAVRVPAAVPDDQLRSLVREVGAELKEILKMLD
ncbi:MAG: MerR family transcriptional regulator [Candidatus Latescibacterota bacterium]|nr:MerR family transcriptional regulator [Candidatus Latescibacterota bacterium]